MSQEKLYLYPRWIRLWHTINAISCLFLIVTGVSMQFSNPKVPMIRFDVAVSLHNIFGILLIVNYIFYFFGNVLTLNGKYYRIALEGFMDRLMAQFKYYTQGIFKGEQAPFPITKERKFNPLQQFTYVMTMYIMVPIMAFTGILLLYPEIIPTKVLGISGLHLNDLLHVIAGFAISMFMFIHIYFCTIGKTPTSNFKSMINGYHEAH